MRILKIIDVNTQLWAKNDGIFLAAPPVLKYTVTSKGSGAVSSSKSG